MGDELKSNANAFGEGVVVGVLLSIVVFVIFFVYIATHSRVEVKSKKKITPEWVLSTDGKKVDTTYIYRNEE